jgi:hypothetical protein
LFGSVIFAPPAQIAASKFTDLAGPSREDVCRRLDTQIAELWQRMGGLPNRSRPRAVLDNLYKFIVPAVAGPVRLVPLAALANPHISASALRVAAARGRLQATRGADGEWRSSRAWVDEYVRGRYRRDDAPVDRGRDSSQ